MIPDVLPGIQLTTGVQGKRARLDDLCGQRDIRGDDQIPDRKGLQDRLIRHVRPGSHPHGCDMIQTGDCHRLIGHQDQRDTGPFGGSKEDISDHLGAGVGINPDSHTLSRCLMKLSN